MTNTSSYKMSKKKIVLLFLILFSLKCLAQGGYFVAKGKIVEKGSGIPLSQSYICIPTTGYGTAPNLEGDFIFQFPNINLDSQVVVALIGYESVKFTAKELKLDSNLIFLEKRPLFNASFGLSDVRILIKSAIDSIPVNYPNSPTYQNGFYFEQINLPTVGAIKINEGIFRVERFPQEKKKLEKVKLLKGKRMEWIGQTAKIDGWGFQNGSDLVCKSIETTLPEFLQKKRMSQFHFRLDSLMTVFDGLPLIIVHFWPINNRLKGGKKGTIYLDPETKAIVRIEYSLTETGLKDLINSNSGAVSIEGKGVNFYTQYRLFNKKWRLQESKVVFDTHFEERLDKKFKIDATIIMRYVSFENLPLLKSNIFPTEILKSTNNFTPSRSVSTEYWAPYSYLKSTNDALKLASILTK